MAWCYQRSAPCPGRETTGCCGHAAWQNANPPGVRFLCGHCGQEHSGQHFCPAFSNVAYGARETRPLTEDDVRRIVREELQRAANPVLSQGTDQ